MTMCSQEHKGLIVIPGQVYFNGSDYFPLRDDPRLIKQITRVFMCMKDGLWRTLGEIAEETGDPEASISAQLRHLRKERFGSHAVNKNHLGNGLYTYQLVVNQPAGECLPHCGVECPYCGRPALLTDSKEVYGTSYGMIWLCKPCNAYVGVHKDSKDHKPLGRLANAELRKSKQEAHAAFDPLWEGKMRRDNCSKSKARKAGYKWLANSLHIKYEHCHIGMFDVEMCKRVVNLCAGILTTRSELKNTA